MIKKVNLRIIILCRSLVLFMGDHYLKKSYIVLFLDFINVSPFVSNSFNIRKMICESRYVEDTMKALSQLFGQSPVFQPIKFLNQ